mgnify:CR=1 FL=1
MEKKTTTEHKRARARKEAPQLKKNSGPYNHGLQQANTTMPMGYNKMPKRIFFRRRGHIEELTPIFVVCVPMVVSLTEVTGAVLAKVFLAGISALKNFVASIFATRKPPTVVEAYVTELVSSSPTTGELGRTISDVAIKNIWPDGWSSADFRWCRRSKIADGQHVTWCR